MALEPSLMQTATSIPVIGLSTRSTDGVFIDMQMDRNTQVLGFTTRSRASVEHYIKTGLGTKESTNMAGNMD